MVSVSPPLRLPVSPSPPLSPASSPLRVSLSPSSSRLSSAPLLLRHQTAGQAFCMGSRRKHVCVCEFASAKQPRVSSQTFGPPPLSRHARKPFPAGNKSFLYCHTLPRPPPPTRFFRIPTASGLQELVFISHRRIGFLRPPARRVASASCLRHAHRLIPVRRHPRPSRSSHSHRPPHNPSSFVSFLDKLNDSSTPSFMPLPPSPTPPPPRPDCSGISLPGSRPPNRTAWCIHSRAGPSLINKAHPPHRAGAAVLSPDCCLRHPA